jgi:hypothetical protein
MGGAPRAAPAATRPAPGDIGRALRSALERDMCFQKPTAKAAAGHMCPTAAHRGNSTGSMGGGWGWGWGYRDAGVRAGGEKALRPKLDN